MKTIINTAALLICLNICQAQTRELKAEWNETLMVSKSTPTLQVVGNPMLRPKGAMRSSALNGF